MAAAKKLPKFLADSDPERLLRATRTERDRVALMSMLYLGLRVSELAALRVEDLDFPRRLAWVREGKGKRPVQKLP